MMFLILIIFYNFRLKKNDQNVKLNYIKNVKKQSIVKLIIVRFLKKLDNSIYLKWGDGQTVAARDQISKGGLTLHVGPKGFRPCLSSYMMMHNNRRLLSDRGGIPKASRLRHGGIAFRILTWILNNKTIIFVFNIQIEIVLKTFIIIRKHLFCVTKNLSFGFLFNLLMNSCQIVNA